MISTGKNKKPKGFNEKRSKWRQKELKATVKLIVRTAGNRHKESNLTHKVEELVKKRVTTKEL